MFSHACSHPWPEPQRVILAEQRQKNRGFFSFSFCLHRCSVAVLWPCSHLAMPSFGHWPCRHLAVQSFGHWPCSHFAMQSFGHWPCSHLATRRRTVLRQTVQSGLKASLWRHQKRLSVIRHVLYARMHATVRIHAEYQTASRKQMVMGWEWGGGGGGSITDVK